MPLRHVTDGVSLPFACGSCFPLYHAGTLWRKRVISFKGVELLNRSPSLKFTNSPMPHYRFA